MGNKCMDEDIHLGTGKYEPKKYWEARAKICKGNIYQAVCAFGLSDKENKAMERIQFSTVHQMIQDIRLIDAYVMELGCGVGRWAPLFLRKGAKYTGVDISESMLKIAKAKVPNGKFYKLDSARLPFNDNEFDMSFSITVLHHNPYDVQKQLVNEMLRVTKVGGVLMVLECVAKERKKTYFNTFARPLDDWIAMVEQGGRAELRKVKLLRWSIVRDGVFKGLRACGIKANRDSMPRLNAFLVTLGYHLDVYLMRLLPAKFAHAACMVFIKKRS